MANRFHPKSRAAMNRRNTRTARRLVLWWNATRTLPFPGGPENGWLRSINPTHWQKAAGHWIWELARLDTGEVYFGSPDPVAYCFKFPESIEND